GITLNTEQIGAKLNIRMNDPFNQYRFNKVTVFFQQDSGSFNLSIQDSISSELGLIAPSTLDSGTYFSTIALQQLHNQISIQTVKTFETQRFATLFGVNLENGQSGILY